MLTKFRLRVTTADGEIYYCTEEYPGEDGWYQAMPARLDGGKYPPLRPVRFVDVGRIEERIDKNLEVDDGQKSRPLSRLPLN